jgi:hypothetical protein
MNDLLKRIATIYALIKELKKQSPNIQVMKGAIQKMMYLLNRELKLGLDFSMYHFGTYSAQVSYLLNLMESGGMIDVEWDTQKGYLVSLKKNEKATNIIEEFENALNEKEKSVIKEMVCKYGSLVPPALFIITTALFVRDEFGVKDDEQLINTIQSLITECSNDCIRRTLEGALIISARDGRRR